MYCVYRDQDQWKPLIKDRAFLPWLVKVTADGDNPLVNRITMDQIVKIETLWKENAEASLRDLDKPLKEEEPQHVLLRYEDGFQYENVFGPLIKMEAEHDRKLKESQRYEGINVRWEYGLNKRMTAFFTLPAGADTELRLMHGDELRIRYAGDIHPPWQGVGNIVKVPDNTSEDTGLELKLRDSHVAPNQCQTNFVIEYVWKSTSFDRMLHAMKRFAEDERAVSSFIYHRLLGHEAEDHIFKCNFPKNFSGKNLPELNRSQVRMIIIL